MNYIDTLAENGPDLPCLYREIYPHYARSGFATTRYHTVIFVEAGANGSGYLHHVTGDITSVGGMSYEKQFSELPEESATFHAKELLDPAEASTYPGMGWPASTNPSAASPESIQFEDHENRAV